MPNMLTAEQLMQGSKRTYFVELPDYDGEIELRPLTIADMIAINRVTGLNPSPYEHATQMIFHALVSPKMDEDQIERLDRTIADIIVREIMNHSTVHNKENEIKIKK